MMLIDLPISFIISFSTRSNSSSVILEHSHLLELCLVPMFHFAHNHSDGLQGILISTYIDPSSRRRFSGQAESISRNMFHNFAAYLPLYSPLYPTPYPTPYQHQPCVLLSLSLDTRYGRASWLYQVIHKVLKIHPLSQLSS